MEKLCLVLVLIGISVFIFSLWSFISIKKHLRQFKNNYIKNSSLTDEKYFELKARQEYIIAISAVIFSIITFIGYTSVDNIKTDINDRLKAEVSKLDSLNKQANESYTGLELRGKDYKDSVVQSLKLVTLLKRKLKDLYEKDIINQNIYIVDDLTFGQFSKIDDHFRLVKFKDLTTVSGTKLPTFKTPPSIIVFSPTSSNPLVDDVTSESFRISPFMYSTSKIAKEESQIKFSIWISLKPLPGKSFNDDFSNDFK